EVLDQFHQSSQLRHTSARYVQHDAASWEIGVINEREQRQPAPILAQQLAQRGNRGPETGLLPVMNPQSCGANFEAITLGMKRSRGALNDFDRGYRGGLVALENLQFNSDLRRRLTQSKRNVPES